MKKFVVIIGIMIGALGLFGCSLDGSVSLPSPNFTMTTWDFRNDFWNLNEYKKVESKYDGKIIRMTGKYCYITHQNGVYSMTLAYYPRPYDLGIYACFSEKNREKLSKLIAGEDVVVQGTAKWICKPPYCTLLLTNATILKP